MKAWNYESLITWTIKMFSLASKVLVTNHVLLATTWFTTCWSFTYSACAQLKGLIHNFICGVVMRGKEPKLNGILSSCYNAWVTFLGYSKRQGYKIIMHGRQYHPLGCKGWLMPNLLIIICIFYLGDCGMHLDWGKLSL
jgi:hypothetical protein